MEYYYEEVEGKEYKEEDIRKMLYDEIVNGLEFYRDIYIKEKDNVKDDLDVDFQLLQLAVYGKIEDVIDEITNVKDMNFVKEED